MMSHVMIDADNIIVNYIVIDEALPPEQQYRPPPGCSVVRADPTKPIVIGWKWDAAQQAAVDPNPPSENP